MAEPNKDLPDFHREKRPWGDFLQFTKEEKTTVKILDIYPGEAISLQYHKLRDEFWYLIRGEVAAIVGAQKKDLKIGDNLYIKKGQKHRLINNSSELAAILEISFGKFQEADEIILEDKYQRNQGI